MTILCPILCTTKIRRTLEVVLPRQYDRDSRSGNDYEDVCTDERTSCPT
eukprot:COSAG02_NODE_26211_length_638_cov_1.031540_2_plen_48_part_01